MSKEALYLVHAEIDPTILSEWNVFHAKEHVPLVVKHGDFLGATRFRHMGPGGQSSEPPRFTTAYRAAGLATIRTYLEGGEVGKMRAHHDAWLAGRRANITREILEENYSVDGDGKPLVRIPDRASGDRQQAVATLLPGPAAFVVRVRVDPSFAGSWSTWYDRDHMPAVVREGAFLRGGRWRVVDETAGPRFVVIYEAHNAETVAAFRSGPGPSFASEHEAKFGAAVSVDREVWAS